MTKKEYRDRLKAAGLCVVCHIRTAAPHKTMCEICAANFNEWRAKRRDQETPEQHEARLADTRNRMNSLHQRRREAGLCTKCGKPAYKGRARCYECIIRTRKAMRKYREEQDVQAYQFPGICRRRGCSKPVVPGKKYCAEHYAKVAETGAKNLKRINLAEHPFRKDEDACYRIHQARKTTRKD